MSQMVLHRGSFKEPELLVQALQHLDIKRCFDEDTLRALRLTSKTAKGLVESAGALAQFCFEGRFKDRRHQYLRQYVMIRNSFQRAESIIIRGTSWGPEDKIFAHREHPKLKKLALDDTSESTATFLSGKFPQLSSLELWECTQERDTWKTLASATWPLQKLSMYDSEVSAAKVAAVLANFSELRKLCLDRVTFKDATVSTTYSTQKIEILELNNVRNLSRSGFFSNGMHFPSLHTVRVNLQSIHNDNGLWLLRAIETCSWVKQLRNLTLIQCFPNFLSELQAIGPLLMSLKGGALESLVLHLPYTLVQPKDWKILKLPNLTNLELVCIISSLLGGDDFFRLFSSSALPMLQEAKIQALDYQIVSPPITSRGIEQFALAFPHLHSFSLSGVTIPQDVFRDFFLHGLPKLAKLNQLYRIVLDGKNETILDIFNAVLGVDMGENYVFWCYRSKQHHLDRKFFSLQLLQKSFYLQQNPAHGLFMIMIR